MVFQPIGIIENNIDDPTHHDWNDVVSAVEINKDYSEGLFSIDQFSHIIVIYWLHRSQKFNSSLCKVHPKGRLDLPLVGIFSTRSPHRPNPIGLAAVRLLEKRGDVLIVKGLDAVNGTPVLDIKPYIPRGDAIADARIPAWIDLL